ncbi:hypothetical protein HDU96_008373 [Phlyctochytrium bullatum]|nr:hypothetical protein HDU96_008373 [Phlyctochytrium bullatum]
MEEDFGPYSFRPLNRGGKLLNRAVEPTFVSTKPSLLAMHSIDEQIKFEKMGKKRVLVRKNAWRKEEDEEGNPYADINVEEIWCPLEKPEDVRKNKSAVRTLRSRQLKILANAAMEIIEREARIQRLLGRLSDVVMMEDPLMQDINLSEGVSPELYGEFRQMVMENLCTTSEFLKRISEARSKLVMAYLKKKNLAKKLAPYEKPKVKTPLQKKRKL